MHVVFEGRVQGVGFRAFVEEAASAHGVNGWVRNRRDGSVEAVFVGAEQAVHGAIAACRNGPPAASVDRLDQRPATEDEAALSSGRFSVLPTL